MARKLLFFLAILCFGLPAFGQYLPYASQVILNQNGLKAAPFAQIIVCTTQTCTAHTGTQATVYSNSTGSGGAKIQPFSADQNGNFSFWTLAGTYYVSTQPSNTPAFITPIAIGGAGTGSGTLTSATIVGTANQITVTGVGSCNSTSVINCQVSLPNAVILGVDNSAAGTLQLANGSSGAHTIIGSAATTTNTILGFVTVPTTGDVVTCTVSGSTCTLTDGGGFPVGTVTSVHIAGTTNQIAVAGTCTITSSGTCTLSFPAGGVTLPATTTGTFSGNLTGNVTGNATTATTATSATTATTATTAAALTSLPSQCTGVQFAQGIAANGNANCATPSGSSSGTTLQTNTVNNTSQVLLNLETSTANSVGLTATPSNPSGGIEKIEITGSSYTGNAATATSATTAANLSGTPALPNGTTATTQTTSDNTTKLSTDAFVNAVIAATTLTINTQVCTLLSSCGIPFSTNGSGNTSINGLNFITSTANSVGLTVTPVNSATNQEKLEITGASYTGNAATATTIPGFTFPTPAGSARVPQVIAKGTSALNTGSVAPGVCETTLTATATGAVAGDNVLADFSVDPFTVTGYNPLSATGMLIISKWAGSGNVNFRVCNSVLNPSTITPGALSVNWADVRP